MNAGQFTATHGHRNRKTGSPTYHSWAGMKGRCLTPSSGNYKNYGAKGVTVCERWMKFENFLADMGVRPDGMTLDRINNDGNYEPGNCRWATKAVQLANRRRAGRLPKATK